MLQHSLENIRQTPVFYQIISNKIVFDSPKKAESSLLKLAPQLVEN